MKSTSAAGARESQLLSTKVVRQPERRSAASCAPAQHALAPDEDFVPVFPSSVSMCFQLDSEGRRETWQLSQQEVALLRRLEACVSDTQWHPWAIGVAEKALLMRNNCQLVRQARWKWYRRLTDTCNMHDRHGGQPVEFPPLLAVRASVPDRRRRTRCNAQAEVRMLTFNMNRRDPDAEFAALLEELDVACLQEVTSSCLACLHALAAASGFSVASPVQRGRCSEEGFDVCIMHRDSVARRLRVSVLPVAGPSQSQHAASTPAAFLFSTGLEFVCPRPT